MILPVTWTSSSLRFSSSMNWSSILLQLLPSWSYLRPCHYNNFNPTTISVSSISPHLFPDSGSPEHGVSLRKVTVLILYWKRSKDEDKGEARRGGWDSDSTACLLSMHRQYLHDNIQPGCSQNPAREARWNNTSKNNPAGEEKEASISFPCLLLFFLQLVKIIPRGLAIFRSCT
jgi:hypothetical protein